MHVEVYRSETLCQLLQLSLVGLQQAGNVHAVKDTVPNRRGTFENPSKGQPKCPRWGWAWGYGQGRQVWAQKPEARGLRAEVLQAAVQA